LPSIASVGPRPESIAAIAAIEADPREALVAELDSPAISGRLCSCGDVGMKLIASMWTIPAALCLSGAFADELTTSGDAKSLGFSVPRRAAAKGVNGRIE
jgi:hypothetical protein